MRLIYLLALDADASAAADVETLLKQRGYQVRRADERMAFPPARAQEITLALWSRAAQLSVKQILFTNRAIDAWTDGRLIVARLDQCPLPRGLSDVGTIDLSFAPARLGAVMKIAAAAQEIDMAAMARRREAVSAPDQLEGSAPFAVEPGLAKSTAKPLRIPGRPEFSSGAAMVVGFVAAAALGSLGLLTMPAAPAVLLAVAAIAWGGTAGAFGGFLGGRQKADTPEPDRAAAAPTPSASKSEAAEAAGGEDFLTGTSSQVFVSYARSNGEVVYPLVAEVEAAGQDVWIDRDELQAGANWAGMIVRAIRDSDTFCLMCSAEAFQSDNVRREIYIADKYKRKLLPVRLDLAQMPEDFEYFLIDRQWLDLTAANPEERADRLKAALGR